MSSLIRKLSLGAVMALIASLTVAGLAAAQTAEEGPPFDAQDTETELSFDFDEESGILYWSLDPEVDCSGPDETGVYHPECNATEVEQNEEGEYNHGKVVSAFAQDVEKGPGVGCLIAEVAMSDEGKTDEELEDGEGPPEEAGCPAGLYDWLQTFAGDDQDGTRTGPPAWVQELLPPQAGDDDDDGLEGESERPENAGPPADVPQGPPADVPQGPPGDAPQGPPENVPTGPPSEAGGRP